MGRAPAWSVLKWTSGAARRPGRWRRRVGTVRVMDRTAREGSSEVTTLDPRQVVEAFDRAVETGDVEALDAVCHPDMLTHSFAPTMPQGIEGMRRFVQGRKALGSSGSWEQVVVVTDGEYVVQYGTRSFDWPGGPFRGFDVPAGHFQRDSAFMFRVQDGHITDRWAIRDDLMMLTQLGVVSPARPEEVKHGTVTSHRSEPFG